MPRAISRRPLPVGLGSPSTTLRRSAVIGLGQVAAPVDARQVRVDLVRAADEVGERACRVVGDRSGTRVPPGRGSRSRCRARARCAPAPPSCSGFATSGSFCALMALSSWSPRITSATSPPSRPSTISVFRQRSAGTWSIAASSAIVRTCGVGTVASAAPGAARGRAGSDGLGLLDVGGVVVAVGERDRVLAGGGEHMELLRARAADRTRIGQHRPEVEAHAREDPHVGVVHQRGSPPRARHRRGGSEYASFMMNSRARMTPKRGRISSRNLSLDVVEVHRQLPVALAAPGARCR